MRAFHSVKNTTSMNAWLQSIGHHFSISVSAYDKDIYKTVDNKEIRITCEQDAYDAQTTYEGMKVKYPQCGVCLGVYGLYI